jgi:hypothetical protein
VSINQAIAIKAGATRLGFYLQQGEIVVHRDGRTITPDDGDTALPDGVTLSRSTDDFTGDVYDVTWADGSAATLWKISHYGLVLLMAPAAARAGTLTGLFGDADGKPQNDVAPKGGAPIEQPAFATLYPGFADSWRVSDDTSLFDYPAGQTTATFTDRAFPSAPTPRPADPTARQACVAAGASDPTDLADCLLDVARTGSAEFAMTSSAIAAFTTAAAAGAAEQPPAGNSTAVADPGTTAVQTFTGRAGQRAFIQVTSSSFHECGSLELKKRDGTAIGLGCLTTGSVIDGTRLPDDGTYRLTVDPAGDATGDVQLAVTVSSDQEQTATVGGAPVTATVDDPGGQSRITFAATAGQRVTVEASDATLPDACGVLEIIAENSAEVDEGCLRQGAGRFVATVPADGRYRLVVDPAGAGTGKVTVRIS